MTELSFPNFCRKLPSIPFSKTSPHTNNPPSHKKPDLTGKPQTSLQGQSMSQAATSMLPPCKVVICILERNQITERRDCQEYSMAPGQALSVKAGRAAIRQEEHSHFGYFTLLFFWNCLLIGKALFVKLRQLMYMK